jgi:hypothetical protein
MTHKIFEILWCPLHRIFCTWYRLAGRSHISWYTVKNDNDKFTNTQTTIIFAIKMSGITIFFHI